MSLTPIFFAVSFSLCYCSRVVRLRCSVPFCAIKGFNAECLHSDVRGKDVKLRCGSWLKVRPGACPKTLCRAACPALDGKFPDINFGPLCKGICPSCCFYPISCQTRFRLYKSSTKECQEICRQRTPGCSLRFCSRMGSKAECALRRGKKCRVIACGKWL